MDENIFLLAASGFRNVSSIQTLMPNAFQNSLIQGMF